MPDPVPITIHLTIYAMVFLNARLLFLISSTVFFPLLMVYGSTAVKKPAGDSVLLKGIYILDHTYSIESYRQAAAVFESVSAKETSNWIPLYYAAFTNVMIGTMVADPDEKERCFQRSKEQVDAALRISPSNDEILTLKAMVLQMLISNNPYRRAFSMAGEVHVLLDQALRLNSENPRAHYLKGAMLFYTPVWMGGGKAKALPWFERAATMFAASTATGMQPHWGTGWAEEMIRKCR